MIFGKKKRLEDVKVALSRDDIIRRSRILVIDDEEPTQLLESLRKLHFSVDYVADITPVEFSKIDSLIYDLLILDFGNVGSEFGKDEGLDLLRHVKRVVPSAVVIAYTSKSLDSKHADFFRLADAVLQKDAGITDSLEKIEDCLRKAHSLSNTWDGLLSVCGIAKDSDRDFELQNLVIGGFSRKKTLSEFRGKVLELAKSDSAKKISLFLVEKLLELLAKSLLE